jgi:hypothetical protein
MRRIFALMVAFGAASLGPLQASACSMLHGQPSGCANAATKTDCERMGMNRTEKATFTVSNSAKSCCAISHAPLPDARTLAGSFAVAVPPALATCAVVSAKLLESAWSPEIARDSSPPSLQSLLCTFLI